MKKDNSTTKNAGCEKATGGSHTVQRLVMYFLPHYIIRKESYLGWTHFNIYLKIGPIESFYERLNQIESARMRIEQLNNPSSMVVT